jgi:hypothetical protein
MAEKALTDRPPHKIYPLLENIKAQVEAKQEETLKILEIIRNAIGKKLMITLRIMLTKQHQILKLVIIVLLKIGK